MAKLSAIACALALLTTTVTAVPLQPRAAPCFIVGNVGLGAEVTSFLPSIAARVTCDTTKTTIDGVPDVISNGIRFSEINFQNAANLTPLEFALNTFATTEPLANNDLQKFQAQESVYLATEDGIRSVGGSLKIKDVRFFLDFQIARIRTAQGASLTKVQEQVDHLLGKVLKNGAQESQATKDAVTTLSTILS